MSFYSKKFFESNPLFKECLDALEEVKILSISESIAMSKIFKNCFPFDLAQKLYAALHPSHNKEFFPLYFLTLTEPLVAQEARLINALQKDGNGLTTFGEKYLLSVNTDFFGNSNSPGESTSYYFSKNNSIRPPDLSLRALFNKFGNEDLYTKYETECKQIEILHAASSQAWKIMGH